ncbi:MAG: hypothetical protein LBQ88_03625 [Treponema sp.]|jgi:hypothetical protein|nr:hypothetical protein [Treponema sp.]
MTAEPRITKAELEKLKLLPDAEQEQIGDEATAAAFTAIMAWLKETGRATITEAEAGRFHDRALQTAIYAHLYGAGGKPVLHMTPGPALP